MNYEIPELPEELVRLQSQTRSLGFQGGRPLNTGATAQGGGAISGGGIMPPASTGWAGMWIQPRGSR